MGDEKQNDVWTRFAKWLGRVALRAAKETLKRVIAEDIVPAAGELLAQKVKDPKVLPLAQSALAEAARKVVEKL